MPEMTVPRQDHGCAGYHGDIGELVLLVTGGYNGYYLTHTEILSGGQWAQVGSLPWPVYIRRFLLHPAGPFTIFFWTPLFKWIITGANIADL